MLDEKNILEYIKKSNLIEINLKTELINNFDKLSINQVKLLIKYFNNQKNEILNLLKTLKDKEICSFEEIKSHLDKLNKDLILKEEFEEKIIEEKNILNLLDTLY